MYLGDNGDLKRKKNGIQMEDGRKFSTTNQTEEKMFERRTLLGKDLDTDRKGTYAETSKRNRKEASGVCSEQEPFAKSSAVWGAAGQGRSKVGFRVREESG